MVGIEKTSLCAWKLSTFFSDISTPSIWLNAKLRLALLMAVFWKTIPCSLIFSEWATKKPWALMVKFMG